MRAGVTIQTSNTIETISRFSITSENKKKVDIVTMIGSNKYA